MRSLIIALLAAVLGAPTADAFVADASKKKVPLIRLQSGVTLLTPSTELTAGLEALELTASALPPAEVVDGSFGFPIVAGKLAGNKPAAGYLRHFGGLRISQADGNHIDLNNPRINDGKTAAVTAQIGDGIRITVATLDTRDATIALTRRRFALDDVGVVLTDAAAEAINTFFNTDAFTGGTTIATATVAAKIRIKLKPFEK